jgi:murein DD-endopeptidase MepM/ murein hydrolase activator NlpD
LTRRRFLMPVRESDIIFLSPDMSWFHRKSTGMEHAIDIAVPIGSEVYAAAAGRVADASEDDDGYKGIDIEHAGGTYTNYGHLSEIDVKEGDEVEEGQVIGLSGDSGNLGGLPPHLHFEAFVEKKGSYDTVPFAWKSKLAVEKRTVEILLPKSVVSKYERQVKIAFGQFGV